MGVASPETQPLPKDQIHLDSHLSCLPFKSSTTGPIPWPSGFLLTIDVHPRHVVRHYIRIQPQVALGTGVGGAHPG